MAWITHHPRSPSFRDLYQKTAGIWAIIGTDRSFDLSWHESLPTDKSIFHPDSNFNLILTGEYPVQLWRGRQVEKGAGENSLLTFFDRIK
jgi:hypothetical protein